MYVIILIGIGNCAINKLIVFCFNKTSFFNWLINKIILTGNVYYSMCHGYELVLGRLTD